MKFAVWALLGCIYAIYGQTNARMVRADFTDDLQNISRPGIKLSSSQSQVKPIIITETYNTRKKQNIGSGAFSKTLPMAVIHKQEALRYINNDSSSNENGPSLESDNQGDAQGNTHVIIIPTPFDDDMFFAPRGEPSTQSPDNKLEDLLNPSPVEADSFDQVSFRVPARR